MAATSIIQLFSESTASLLQYPALCKTLTTTGVYILNNLPTSQWLHRHLRLVRNSTLWLGLVYSVILFTWPVVDSVWQLLGDTLEKIWYYVFSFRCRESVVHLLFISCTPAVHLMSPCCSSYLLLLCLLSASCSSFVLSKLLFSSSAFHLMTLGRSQDALERHTPVPLFFLLALETIM